MISHHQNCERWWLILLLFKIMESEEKKQSEDNLIVSYLKGELTADETGELISWIKMSRANKRYFDEYCEIWISAKAALKNPGYSVQEGFWKFKQRIKINEDSGTGVNRTYSFKTILRYAAIIIITFSISGLLFYNTGKSRATKPEKRFSELIVPMGSKAMFTLIDGTVVTLNAGSRLKYDNMFGVNERVVQLEGEGYFKVAKDACRPFIVKTSYLNMRALGTEFNVKAYADDSTIETTLVEGSVKIERVNSQNNTEVLVLKPNQKFTFYKEDSKLADKTSLTGNVKLSSPNHVSVKGPAEVAKLVEKDVNVTPIISWKENRWIFEKECLSEIAIDLERRFDVKIVFQSERLKSITFTGIILAEPIEQVLKVMSVSAPIDFKMEGRVVTLGENKKFTEISKRINNHK